MTRAIVWIGVSMAVAACGASQSGPTEAGDDAGGAVGDDGTGGGSGVGASSGVGVGASSGVGVGVGVSSGSGASSGVGGSSGSGSGVGASSGSGSGASSGVGASSGASGTLDGGGSSGSRTDAGGSSGTTVDAGRADAGGGGSSGGNAACTWSGALRYSGSASFTCYYFGQGTTMSGGGYKTACGYNGRETTGGSGNNCGQAASDTIDNVANTGLAKSTYFAAIPGDSNGGFSNVVHCGECAELTNPANAHSVVVTIIDECPIDGNQNSPCKSAGHLDVSMQAFNALDYSSGDPSGTTWKSVPCPVTGTIQAVLNAGIASQVYFQNAIFPVRAVSGATQSQYGYWQFGSGGAGGTATLTDVEGHTVTAIIPGGGGDLKVQFPSPGTCN